MRELGNKVYSIVSDEYRSEEAKITEIKKLIDEGYDVNCNLFAGFTVLHYAVLREEALVCEFLVKYGANPHIENCDGNTPLALANGRSNLALRPDEKLIKILKLSTCSVFLPGMNRRGEDDARHSLIRYNKKHGLNLEMGAIFR